VRVGFVGLGSQGAPIAARIAASGEHELTVWARRPEQAHAFVETNAGAGVAVAPSIAELAEGLDVLGLCVFGGRDVHEVLFGDGGAAAHLPGGALIICHSTVAPGEIVEVAQRAAEFGLHVLDAPVSGGAPKASIGELVVMAGGEMAAYERALPVLRTYSNQVVRLGPVGAGQHAKLINNAVMAANLAVAHDAFALGAQLGLDAAALTEILRAGSGRSYGLEVMAGAGGLDRLGPALAPTLTKDVALVEDLAAGSGATLLGAARALIAELSRPVP